MKKAIMTMAILCLATPALAQDMPSAEEMQQMQQMMNDPAYKKQMQDAVNKMQARGMDTKALEKTIQNPKSIEAAMGMGQCMNEKVGKTGMDNMSRMGKQLEANLSALCKAGKRDEAEKAAAAYAKKLQASKEYKSMLACTEKYKDQLNDPSYASLKKEMERANPQGKDRHVCDYYSEQKAQ